MKSTQACFVPPEEVLLQSSKGCRHLLLGCQQHPFICWKVSSVTALCVVVPVQITLIGSDGREYTFLAKPKDDLRKDQRMMEVAGVMNRLFAREPASRRRNLYLRRFSLPSCGHSSIHASG